MLPLIAGAAASLLPAIVSALLGSKNEQQAREAVMPQYNAMVARYIGSGMDRQMASEKADEEIKGAVSEKMQEGALPPWLELALSVPAGLAGGALAKVGMRALGKGAAKLAGAEAMEVGGAKAAKGAIPEGPKAIKAQGTDVASGEGDPTKFEAGSAGLSKGELPAVADPPHGLVTPFGPKPAPRRMTPVNQDLMEHNMPDRRGIFDSIAPEFSELGAEEAETLIKPFARRALSPADSRMARMMAENPQGY